ncbi:hypothetical protein [Nocardia sp. NPDC056100]|uniref:hypothetical protein n=1 Tax=Nocardia sp. NPDC056100 TaxID=3345712 RepID=UPI0035DA6ADC
MWALLCAGCTQHVTSPGPSATADADLNERPANLKSVLFQGISLPVANQGPRSQDGAVVSGFDRGPIGAALAAIQATVRISVATDSQWAAIGQQMLAPGLGRDAWAVARAQISITAPITGTAPLIGGYRIVHYSSTDAAVDIYTTQSDRSITCNTAQVIWQGNDWKLLLPNQPHSAAVTAVPALPADAIALPLH